MPTHRISLLVLALVACGRIGYTPLSPTGAAGAGALGTGGGTTLGSGGTGGGAVVSSGGVSGVSGSGGAAGSSGGSAGGRGGAAGGSAGASGGAAGGSTGAGGGAAGSAGIGDAGLVDAGAACPAATFNGHSYELCAGPLGWTAAQNDCVAKGMQLARIDDAAENSWLQATAFAGISSVSSVYWPWIGGTDSAMATYWAWTDGELYWIGGQNGSPQNGLYVNWVAGSPSTGGSAGQCAIFQHGGFWADATCSNLQPYVCEQY